MEKYRIAVIPGDGIGPEVLTEGMKLLKTVSELDGGFCFEDVWFPWGCQYYLKNGRMMPEDCRISTRSIWGQWAIRGCRTIFPSGSFF